MIKMIDVPGEPKPISIKVNSHDGEFSAVVDYRHFRNKDLQALEAEIAKHVEGLAAPTADEWEPIIVLYMNRGQHYIFAQRRFFVLRNDKGKIAWYCDFARHSVDHPGLPDMSVARRAVRDDEIESPHTVTAPYTPIAWERLNRAIGSMEAMRRAIVTVINEAAVKGTLVQRADSVLEDAARAAMDVLKNPPTEEERNNAQ